MSRYFYTVEQIDRMLIGRMESLARTLAPDGEKRGHEWVAINPARPDKKRGSFSINLVTGVWKDFAGDAGARTLPGLGLVAYLATKGDFQAAIGWAKDWLGLTGEMPSPAMAAKVEAQLKRAREDETHRREAKLNAAFAIFLEAKPLDGEDPASKYLKGRGLDPKLLPEGRFPRSLRWHSGISHPHINGKFNALIACQSLEGRKSGFAGIHRIYIVGCMDGSYVKAFNGVEAKLSLGYQAGASIRISAGVSGKKLADAPDGEWVHVTEGIEDGLSLAVAMPERRVVAVYSVAAFGLLTLPAQLGGVVIVRDNDDPKSKAEEALENAALKLCDRHAVKIARMPEIFKDVNDCLQGKRRGA